VRPGNEISQYQTFDLVQRAYNRKHDRKLNAQRNWEIIRASFKLRHILRARQPHRKPFGLSCAHAPHGPIANRLWRFIEEQAAELVATVT
jgi:hypothetical protein